MPFGSGLTKPHWMEAQNETIRAELGGRFGGRPALGRDDSFYHVGGDSMSTKQYRPWELHRPAHRCAACGRIAELGENGLCVECEGRWDNKPLPEEVSWQRESRDTW